MPTPWKFLDSHLKLLIGSKLSLGYQEIKFLLEEPIWFYTVWVSIKNIINTYKQYKTKLAPLEEIWFPANLGLVLTQLTTWDDWQAV